MTAVAPGADRQRFAGFVLTGGIAAAVNIGARWLLSLTMVYELAVTLAYLVGMTTAFILSRQFVFDASGRRWHRDYLRFAAVNAGSFLVVLAVSVGLARALFPAIGFTWHAEDLAHVIGVVSPVVLSYYAHKHYSFAGAGRGA